MARASLLAVECLEKSISRDSRANVACLGERECVCDTEVRHFLLAEDQKDLGGVSDLFSVLRILFLVTWYVHVGEKLDNADYTVRYIGRYAKRPSVSEAKIVSYDGEYVIFQIDFSTKIS